MKKFKAALVCAATIIFAACSATHQVFSPEEMNRHVGKGNTVVHLKSGVSYDARGIVAAKDTAAFINRNTKQTQRVGLRDVQSFEKIDRFSGSMLGLFIGAISGAAAGCLVGTACDNAPGAEMHGLVTLFSVACGGVLGGTSGFVYGAIHGNRESFEFTSDTTAAKAHQR